MLPSVLLAAGLLLGTAGYGATDTSQPTLADWPQPTLADLAKTLAGVQANLEQLKESQSGLGAKLDAIQASVSLLSKSVVLGKRCSLDTDCSSRLSDAECRRDGSVQRCSCKNGFRQVLDSECRRLPHLSEACLGDEECKSAVANAACTDGTCSCPIGFRNHNDAECQRISCAGDQDCPSGHNLQCVSGHCSCPVTTVGGYEYRLSNGTSCTEGNVELRRTGGSWGLVCDDHWDIIDASVLCRSLGFSSGHEPTENSWFGKGSVYHMDDVKCDGSETHLMMCVFGGWGNEDCSEGEVAGARCS